MYTYHTHTHTYMFISSPNLDCCCLRARLLIDHFVECVKACLGPFEPPRRGWFLRFPFAAPSRLLRRATHFTPDPIFCRSESSLSTRIDLQRIGGPSQGVGADASPLVLQLHLPSVLSSSLRTHLQPKRVWQSVRVFLGKPKGKPRCCWAHYLDTYPNRCASPDPGTVFRGVVETLSRALGGSKELGGLGMLEPSSILTQILHPGPTMALWCGVKTQSPFG